MADALDQLKSRARDLGQLAQLGMLLSWDQRTQMPPAGARHRGEHMAFLQRTAHDVLADPEMGRLLDELEPRLASLDPDGFDYGLIRLLRRNYEKEVKVPAELREEMARAAAEGNAVWLKAKAASDFQLFLPALERNIETRHKYVDAIGPDGEPYDILLDDFEPEMKTEDVTRIFAEIRDELVPLIAELSEREVDDAFLEGDYPIDRQIELLRDVTDTFGHRPDSWRIDPTEHPFASSLGRDDIRITTHYYANNLDSLFSTMHEYGHGLYQHQLPAGEYEGTPVAGPCSLGIHESQSRLWENLVGRSLPFWRFYYPRVQERFPDMLGGVDVEQFYAAVNKSQPSLIRIEADEVTYGMHVILRFELEQDIINSRVELKDLPDVWGQKMHDYLGVEVPDDAHGVLQDMHWSTGLIGYVSTYLLGTVMSVQIWEKMAEDVGDLDELMERGEFTPIREWLGEHVHGHGRKYPPQELLQKATGSTIDAKPYLNYLKRKYGVPVTA
jgi:carboxypeptidase Taq